MQTCDNCKTGILKKKNIDYILRGKKIGKFTALVCDNCQETLYDGRMFRRIEKAAKKRGF